MNFNDRYENDLLFIQNKIGKNGKLATDGAVCDLLGKNVAFFTNKRNSKSGFTKEDLVWLHYNFADILENPIVKNIEVAEQEDKSEGQSDANSDRSAEDKGESFEQKVLASLQFLQTLAQNQSEEISSIKGILTDDLGMGTGAGVGKKRTR